MLSETFFFENDSSYSLLNMFL